MYYMLECFFTTAIEFVMLYCFCSFYNANEIFYFSCILLELFFSSFYKKIFLQMALFIDMILILYIFYNFTVTQNIYLIFFCIMCFFLVVKNFFRIHVVDTSTRHENLINNDYETVTVISV